MKDHILIVDDERSMREFLRITLRKEGYRVSTASNPFEALDLISKELFDLVITDIKMPQMDGIELLKRIKALNSNIPVIMITAYASVDTAVEAMKEGAYDYISKPFNVEELKHLIGNALERKRLERENILLKRELRGHLGFGEIEGIGEIVGRSPKMKEIYELVLKVAGTNTNIFITGESGVGKELIARAIHRESPRKNGPFVPVNCGAIPSELMESELFGYEKGAFTGAVSTKKGLFEVAHGGTLFLDEVTELAPHLQVKLLRAIQDRRIRRLGGVEDIVVDVRIISATNRDILKAVKEGRMREDLYYRLNVIPIHVPPLRERKEDIPLLADYFVGKANKRFGKDIKGIETEALEVLINYDFPGNVRELENIIERAVALEEGEFIRKETILAHLEIPPSLPPEGLEKALGNPEEGRSTLDFNKIVEETEKRLLLEALKRAGGVKKKAAELLNISFRSFRYLLNKYDIK